MTDSLIEKIDKLGEKYLFEHNQNAALKIQVSQAIEAINILKINNKQLLEDIELMRSREGIYINSENNFETKQKINELAREIDKCIQLLKQNT